MGAGVPSKRIANLWCHVISGANNGQKGLKMCFTFVYRSCSWNTSNIEGQLHLKVTEMKEYEEFVVSSLPEVCPSFYFVMLNRESFPHLLSIKIIKVTRSYQKLQTQALIQNMFLWSHLQWSLKCTMKCTFTCALS